MSSLHGRTAVVTGASSGVGFVAARHLAAGGTHVVMVSRHPERGAAALAQVSEAASGPAPDLLLGDLSSQAKIRRLAAEMQDRHDRIDVLLNNAGGVFAQRELTVDGIERTFATNHLAPFLLTNLLLDLVVAAPNARVVTVVTEIYAGKLDFDNLQSERRHQFFRAYQRTKLCALLFAFELARQLEGTGATSNAVSPGPTKTRFGDDLTGAAAVFPKVMKRLPMFSSPEKGACTLLYAATAPELEGVSGRFFKSREHKTRPVAGDREVAARLWQISEALCRLSLGSAISRVGGHDA